MEIDLIRFNLQPEFTQGRLYIDGVFECYTCEDFVRTGEKVYGKTAIPVGRYRVIVNMSNRFKQLMPLLVNVPGFEGIRIHPGNTAQDTLGCILPGKVLTLNGVSNSRAAYKPLFAKIQNAIGNKQDVFINIK